MQRPAAYCHSGCRAGYPGSSASYRSNAGHPGSARYPNRPRASYPPRTRDGDPASADDPHRYGHAAAAIAPVPEPVSEPLISVGNWQIYTKTYGEHTIAYAANQAIEYETDANSPILTYQCFRGQSSLFIEWQQRFFTRPAPASARHAKNPF